MSPTTERTLTNGLRPAIISIHRAPTGLYFARIEAGPQRHTLLGYLDARAARAAAFGACRAVGRIAQLVPTT